VFRVVRQMVKQNRDAVGSGCVKDVEGKVVDFRKVVSVGEASPELVYVM